MQLQELLDQGSYDQFPVGSTDPICEKEGRVIQAVYQLLGAEQANGEKPLSASEDR